MHNNYVSHGSLQLVTYGKDVIGPLLRGSTSFWGDWLLVLIFSWQNLL